MIASSAAYNYKTDTKLQARLLAEVVALIEEPANCTCCDCGAKLRARAAFCSITLGVWLCNRCYGIHRSVGAHVTRTKCVGLDAFSQAEVDFMRAYGNARAKQQYEATVPSDVRRPSATSGNSEAEEWIRAKYEHRKYFRALSPPVAQPAAQQASQPQSMQPSLIDFGSAPATSAPPPAAWQPSAQAALNPLELYAQSLGCGAALFQPTQPQQPPSQQSAPQPFQPQQQPQPPLQPQSWDAFAAAPPNRSRSAPGHDQRKNDIMARFQQR